MGGKKRGTFPSSLPREAWGREEGKEKTWGSFPFKSLVKTVYQEHRIARIFLISTRIQAHVGLKYMAENASYKTLPRRTLGEKFVSFNAHG